MFKVHNYIQISVNVCFIWISGLMVLMLCLRINATYYVNGDRRGRDRMVVGFTTTCAITQKVVS